MQFPDVLKQMSDKLEWTQKLGDAFLAQQDDVMDEIQLLRGKAAMRATSRATSSRRWTKQAGGQPISHRASIAGTVYVPVYEPSVVYGPWWYPDYPPYYWPYPGARFVNGYFWGAGVAIAGGDLGLGPLRLARPRHRYQRQQVEQHQRQARKDHKQQVGAPSRSSRARALQRTRRRARSTDKPRARRPATRNSAGTTRTKWIARKIEARLKDTDHAGDQGHARDAGRRRRRRSQGAQIRQAARSRKRRSNRSGKAIGASCKESPRRRRST